MRPAQPKKRNASKPARSVLEMSSKDAREFFLEPGNYCSLELPTYLGFGKMLKRVSSVLSGKKLREITNGKVKASNCENVNHSLYDNKDGKYAWRPYQIIHPALYVSLINEITSELNWKAICERFETFQANKRIQCLSIPLKSMTKASDKAAQISNWWNHVEQASVEMSLEYDFTIHTDIVDCYGSIYTHSIAWALHTRAFAKSLKSRTNKDLIGNLIDTRIRDMRYGQTNGIPQGSALMDFVAEMVLGYADTEITKKIERAGISDYRILRYRDDYRVFTNSSQDGERILKCITEGLLDLGLKLGAAKTKVANSVVASSIKKDKIAWVCRKQRDFDLQKHLLIIHEHSVQFANSGSLVIALKDFHKRVVAMKTILNPMPIIGILVDIAFHNPRTYPIFAAILSRLLSTLSTSDQAKEVVRKVKRKFEKLPNTGHMQLWLQRISFPISEAISYEESLCKLVAGESPSIWNNEWISSKAMLKAVETEQIVDRKKLAKVSRIVPVAEMALFISRSDY